MSTALQTNFIKFYNSIKFDRGQNKQQLIQKSQQLVHSIRTYLKKNQLPSIKQVYNQGSYGGETGVKPTKGRDFDIDVALIFDIKIEDYKDPTIPKQWVKKAIDTHTHKQAEILPACVRVNYSNYHVDFAIYGLRNQVKHIAKGQKNSQPQNKKWEPSPSKKLMEKLKKNLTGEEKAQYKRLICYLKRWKDERFKAKTNEAPTGIALTVMVYQWFQPQIKNGLANDLKALQVVLNQVKNNNYGLGIKLPMAPHNNLLEDINQSSNHRTNYIKRMKALHKTITAARQTQDSKAAAQLLQAQFGKDFPL